MSEHKYKDAYNKGYEKGKQEAFSGYCMSCYDELSLYEQAKLMVEWGADIPNILDKIRAEIEPKCDRINSLASVLPYTAHREIQELLCEIMSLCKAESGASE